MPSNVRVELKEKKFLPTATAAKVGVRDDVDVAKSRVVYRAASGFEDVDSCLRLVHEAYVSSGIMDPHPAHIRVIPQHTLPTTEVLMATMDGRVACTSTLVLDGKLGLPMEAIFDDEVDTRRQGGNRLAEVSCLAHAKDIKVPLSVITGVMAMTAQCAKHRGIDELLVVVHPHHADFYRGFLGFEPFGSIKRYACVRDNPAAALSLDMNELQSTNPRGYKRLFGKPFPEEVLRRQPLPTTVHNFLGYLMKAA